MQFFVEFCLTKAKTALLLIFADVILSKGVKRPLSKNLRECGLSIKHPNSLWSKHLKKNASKSLTFSYFVSSAVGACPNALK